VELEPNYDKRGFFARGFCAHEFQALGLEPAVAQCNVSFSEKAGTVRGLHFQAPPHMETKLIRCTRCAVYDVVVDIRSDSRTYLSWYAVELTQDNRRMIFVPHGFAQGIQTLVDNSEVFYMMSEFYHAESQRALRWDDPALCIPWPLGNPIVSDWDRSHALLDRSQK
jgi:dTDP-4-dehydrorhamnose 3,5-epimerase